MASKNRVRHGKGRLIPGGKGPAGLNEWGYEGLMRVIAWLRALRRERGLPAIAAASGLSVNTLRNVCDGDREPTPEMAQKIAAAVGANLNSVVKGRAA
jgi:DNA-binding phage protein